MRHCPMISSSRPRTRLIKTGYDPMGGSGAVPRPRHDPPGGAIKQYETGRVLSKLVDVVMARVIEHRTIVSLRSMSFRARTACIRPRGDKGDMCTIFEHLPRGRSSRTGKVVFVGDGASARRSASSPRSTFRPLRRRRLSGEQHMQILERNCQVSGGSFRVTDERETSAAQDFIYTDVWCTACMKTRCPRRSACACSTTIR